MYALLLEQSRRSCRCLRGVFAITDGAQMNISTNGDPFRENSFWEGFTEVYEATSLNIGNFFGKEIYSTVKLPGSWHDSKVSASSVLYFSKLGDEMTLPVHAV